MAKFSAPKPEPRDSESFSLARDDPFRSVMFNADTPKAKLQELTAAVTGIPVHEVDIYPQGEHVVRIDRWDDKPVYFWIMRLNDHGHLESDPSETRWFALPLVRAPGVRRKWNLSPKPCACKIVAFVNVNGDPTECPFCQGDDRCAHIIGVLPAAEMVAKLNADIADELAGGPAAAPPAKPKSLAAVLAARAKQKKGTT